MSSTLFNEIGISLVRGGSWMGLSHEIETNDGEETRALGWKYRPIKTLEQVYFRLWIGKKVFVISTKQPVFQMKTKNKWAFKSVLGFSFPPE